MTDPLEEASKLALPFEGFSSRPYLDPAGVWTIGYGSTRDGREGRVTAHTHRITRGQALRLLHRDMRRALEFVGKAVFVPLTTEQEAALGDFVYNLGGGNLARSTLLRLLNAGDYEGAAAQLDLWVHAGGKVLAGLVRRRAAEKKLFTG